MTRKRLPQIQPPFNWRHDLESSFAELRPNKVELDPWWLARHDPDLYETLARLIAEDSPAVKSVSAVTCEGYRSDDKEPMFRIGGPASSSIKSK